MPRASQKLQEHIAQEHKQLTVGRNLKEIVYGGIDGIVTTFAVVAGFSGANTFSPDALGIPVAAVLLFGLANLFADGFSMGIGDYLSARAEKKQYDREYKKERAETQMHPEMEVEESLEIYMSYGMTKNDAKTVVNVYKKYPEIWTNFMMRYELELPEPEDEPLKSALYTFFSFLCFGFIPLIPYVFGVDPAYSFAVSSIAGLVALTALGVLRSRFTKEGVFLSVGEIVALGTIAGIIAYGVGVLFHV
jgi:VIT1/CCC1 family predicted Fe2+/Mn2+ transporter